MHIRVWSLLLLTQFSVAAASFSVDISFINDSNQAIQIMDKGNILSGMLVNSVISVKPNGTYTVSTDHTFYLFNDTLPRRFMIIGTEDMSQHLLETMLEINSDGSLKKYTHICNPIPGKKGNTAVTESVDPQADHLHHSVTISNQTVDQT